MAQTRRDPRMLHTQPLPRLLALIGVGVVLVFYRPGADPALVHGILLPAIALLSAWYLTGSAVAIAFAVMLLASAHSDRAGGEFAAAVAYPAIAILAATVLTVLLLLRFRQALLRRRAARNAGRAARETGECLDPDTADGRD